MTTASANLSPSSNVQQLTAEPKDSNGAVIKDDDKFFVPSWESSNPDVATVDQSGLVSRVAAGNAQITATFANIKIESVRRYLYLDDCLLLINSGEDLLGKYFCSTDRV